MTAFPNSLFLGALHNFRNGECAWTARDWYAVLVKYPFIDLERIAVKILLDYTWPLGKALESEVLFRRAAAKADAIGSECFCVYHDCDAKDCPPGAHDD